MRLFGGILPFIGFRVVEVSIEDARDLGIQRSRMTDMDHVLIESLEVEWLGYGFMVAAKGVA